MNRDDPLMETAILGKEAELFIGSEIGKYMIARAQMEIDQASYKLKRVFPLRWRRIMQLQNEIDRAERFQSYLADMYTDGQAAMKTLNGEDNGSE